MCVDSCVTLLYPMCPLEDILIPLSLSLYNHISCSFSWISEQPADYRLFLEELTGTQMFTQFIDERSSPAMPEDRIKDITFFDESIDAKMNRYMFNLQKIDTPFLLDDARLHVKTFVPPSPNIENLPQNNTQDTQSIGVKSNRNHRFPRLK